MKVMPEMYAYTQDVPIGAEMYEKIQAGIGAEVPDGLLVHLAVELPEGGLRYIDVWQSEEQCERFVDERVHPVVHPMLRPIFGDQLPPEPERVPMNVVHVWGSMG